MRRYRVGRPSAQDGVVLGITAVWWLLAPLQVDDGWVRGRQVNSLVSGGFSNYYDDYGANLPLATWYEWIQHFVMTGTDSLGVHRLFSFLFVVATWFVSRWCLVELTGRRPSRSDATWWVSAAVFGIGATAFGMTLRPEPAIALMAVAVLACCIRYLRAAGVGPLVVAILLVGLALTIHPAGAVALAPLFVCLPRVIGDARRRAGVTVVEVALVVCVGMAWTTLLAVLDFDLSSRDESIGLIQDAGHSSGLVQETERYELLWQWGASPPRRELVALPPHLGGHRARRMEKEAGSAGAPSGRLRRDRASAARVRPQQVDLALRRVHGPRRRGHRPRVRPIRPGPRLGALAVGGRGRGARRIPLRGLGRRVVGPARRLGRELGHDSLSGADRRDSSRRPSRRTATWQATRP